MALEVFGPAAVAELCDGIGIDRRLGNRAMRGRQVNASAFVQMCCAIGLNPYTGGAREKLSVSGPILWWFLGAAVNLHRIGDGLSQRDAAKEASVHYTTICRIENMQPVSTDNYLAVCKWLGADVSSFTGNGNCNKREAA